MLLRKALGIVLLSFSFTGWLGASVPFEVPATSVKKTLRIGTFNLMRFSDRSANKNMSRIMELISKANYDVFAAVEILSKPAATQLLHSLQENLDPNWQMLLSDESTGESSYKEFFAFYYRSNTLKPLNGTHQFCNDEEVATTSDGSHCFVKDEHGTYERDPFVGHFKFGKTFLSLVAVHIYYGNDSAASEQKRHEEVTALKDVVEVMKNHDSESNIMVMGDFNLEFPNEMMKHASFPMEVLSAKPALTGLFYDATTIGRSNFDHILFFKDSALSHRQDQDEVILDFDLDDLDQKAQYKHEVSDHFPIVSEFDCSSCN